MKKKQYIVFYLFAILQLSCLAQVNNLNLQYNSIPGIGCHSNMSVCLSSGIQPESGAQIIVDWTDGTQDTVMAYLAPNSQSCYMVEHDYNQVGTFQAVVTVTSGTLSGQLVGTETIDWTISSTTNCGFFTVISLLNPSAIFLQNVPYDLTDNLGNVSTIYPKNAFSNMYYSELNTANAPFTVSINDQWLQNNGYSQTAPDFTIASFDASGRAENTPMNITLECSGTGSLPDIELTAAAAFQFIAPLQTGNIHLQVCNISCGNFANSTLKIAIPPMVIPDLSGLSNASFSNDTVTVLLPYLNGCQSIGFPCSFPGTTTAGTVLQFHAQIFADNEQNFLFNQLPFTATVSNSFDPNEKTCNLPRYIQPDIVDTLHYMIHFQNDGNYPALNVVIRDTLSPNLDLSSFRFIDSKHPVSYSLDIVNRALEFRFSGIQLTASTQNLDSSQGYVSYAIKENSGLPIHSEITNTAYIYFDFNPAIVTNTTIQTNDYLGIHESESSSFSIVPNPSSGSFTLHTVKNGEVSIYTMQGQRILTQVVNGQAAINVEQLSSGSYQLIFTTADEIWNAKLMIK